MTRPLRLLGAFLFAALATACASAPKKAPVKGPSPMAYSYVVISVADMNAAMRLWRDRFGMEVSTVRSGNDPGLAKSWGLPPDGIVEQALLNTPGLIVGGVHLVQFRKPGPSVRAGAQPMDLVPKSVDIAVVDIEKRYGEMTDGGFRFRSPIGKLNSQDGKLVLEAHTTGPDDINLVLVEQPGTPEPVSPKGFGVAPQIVLTTDDNTREANFLQQVLGLKEMSHNRFSGPSIEKTVGLPAGAALDIRIMGSPDSDFGRLEIVQYEGAKGTNLYPKAVPPARGMLGVTYVVTDLAPILERGKAYGIKDHGRVRSILGEGRMASVTSPAGLRIDIVQL